MTTKSAPLFVSIVALVLLRYKVVAGGDCYDLLDIVHVQDVSSSFQPFLPDLATKIGGVLSLMRDDLPGVHFGFASFGDKNISKINPKTKEVVTLGVATDYCLRVDQPLQWPDALAMSTLFQGFQNKPVEGEDSPTGVFEALYRAVTASSLRWRQEPLGGKKVGRYIVLVTGAPSRLGGDVSRVMGKTVQPFDITPYKIRENRNNENYGCDKVEYPTIEQVVKLVKGLKDTHILVLVAPGGTFDSKCQFDLYKSLAGLSTVYQNHAGLYHWYEEKFRRAGLSKIIVAQLDYEMFIYDHAILGILSGSYNKTICRKAAAS